MDKFKAKVYDLMDVDLIIEVVKFDKYQVKVKTREINEWWSVWVLNLRDQLCSQIVKVIKLIC